jgi:hypothetical protein
MNDKQIRERLAANLRPADVAAALDRCREILQTGNAAEQLQAARALLLCMDFTCAVVDGLDDVDLAQLALPVRCVLKELSTND